MLPIGVLYLKAILDYTLSSSVICVIFLKLLHAYTVPITCLYLIKSDVTVLKIPIPLQYL